MLGLVDEPGSARRLGRPSPLGLVASLAIVLAASFLLAWPPDSPRGVSALDLHGAAGAAAHVVVGPPEGANRQVQLDVQRLNGNRYYELWSVRGDSRMLLATFMTNPDGSCRVTLSVPSTIQPGDLAVAPRAEAQFVLAVER